MSFFDTFSQKFAQYKRENKKSLKGLKTEAQAKLFLNSRGTGLKKDLEKAIKNKEKINFGGLPKAAKTFFGTDFVPKFKRKIKWENAELIRLNPGTFKFNESNQMFVLLENLIKGSEGGFFTDEITSGNDEDKEKAIQQAIKKEKDIKNIDQVFDRFNKMTNRQNSNVSWEAWGLFTDDDQYKIFINFPGEKAAKAPPPPKEDKKEKDKIKKPPKDKK